MDGLRVLPGVGERTASRMAVDILSLSEARALRLLDAIDSARRLIRPCQQCHGYAESELCTICASERAEHPTLCIVRTALDIWQIEETRKFDGSYHVLGGVLSPIDGIGPDDLNFTALLERMQKPQLREVVFALPGTPEGDATARMIRHASGRSDLQFTHLAYGIPIGGSLELLDSRTLGFALDHRRSY